MPRRPLALVTLASLSLIPACKSKPDDVKKEPASAVTSEPAPPPSARVEERKPEPPFTRFASVPLVATVFPAGDVAVLCEAGCTVPDKVGAPPPRTFLLSGKTVTEDKSLWPMGAYLGIHTVLAFKHFAGHAVAFDATPSGELWVKASSYMHRSGEGVLAQPLRRVGKGWDLASEGHDRPPAFSGERARKGGAIPPAVAPTMTRAPFSRSEVVVVHGGSGPPALLVPSKIALWSGSAWTTSDAPWGEVDDAIRLASGATLVQSGKTLHLVSTTGAVSPAVGATELADATTVTPHRVARRAVVAVRTPTETRLLAWPDGGALPEPEAAPAPPAPAPAITAAPRGSASAAASAAPTASAAPAASGPAIAIPAPGPFTAACTTPFVILVVRPEGAGAYDYPLVREALRGHPELADAITLFEFGAAQKLYFGAQVKDEATARKIVELVAEKKVRAQLGCLDVLARVPDRNAPPAGVRVLNVNLTTGELY